LLLSSLLVCMPQQWEVAADQNVDPFALVRDEVGIVSERLCQSIVSNVPALEQAAEYFFRPGVRGKRLRPTLLLLMSSALSDQQPPAELLLPDHRPPHERPQEQRRRQQRIAEIAELIHVASLLHDDVLDDAETRRGISSLNAQSGNKLAILAGDFLLARASVTLASLQNTEIVELLSRVLEHLVAGEVMQMSAGPEQLTSMAYYLDKTFYKTASLMANSSRAVAILGEQQLEVCDLAWQYGRHLVSSTGRVQHGSYCAERTLFQPKRWGWETGWVGGCMWVVLCPFSGHSRYHDNASPCLTAQPSTGASACIFNAAFG
jgi:geranyl diphosphate synthase